VTSLWDPALSDEGTCTFAAEPGPDLYIFGDVFMRNYYTTFDAKNSKLKFTPSVHSIAIVEPFIPFWTIVWVTLFALLLCCCCISLVAKKAHERRL
jgi:hypothetical protein